MATFMSTLLGCNVIDNRIIDSIKNTLSEKYNKSFTVASLGDRIDRDTATAYVYADEDPTLRFVVRVNKNGDIIYEEYLYRLLCRTVENKINKTFEKYSIESECFVTFTPRKNINVSPDMTFDEFVNVNSPETALASIIVLSDADLTGENIVNIYTEICDYLDNVNFGTGLYALTENDFNAVKEKIQHEVETFDTQQLKYYGVSNNIKELLIKVVDKEMPLTSLDIDFALGKV